MKRHPAARMLAAAGPTVSPRESNRALGISDGLGYGLIARGEYPAKVLRLGRRYRVVTADLRRVLGITDEPAA